MAETISLLGSADPHPVLIRNAAGRSPFLLLSDHSGRLVPRRLGDLGVPPAEMERHIAWDIGIDEVGRMLAESLDAVMIGQRYSRLVIDCNRRPGHMTSIPPVSDGTVVPGNAGLGAADAAARVHEIFEPYHAAIASELDRRASVPTAVIALHSFTPMLRLEGAARPWPVGVLHDRDPAFALTIMELLRAREFLVGDNEPYALSDASDYTVVVHAEGRGLPYVELEIRQDLIADEAGQRAWAAVLAEVLPAAWAAFGISPA
jgi:predicted N-formylglutamate amidohydrolase